jgi:hypothetical protein
LQGDAELGIVATSANADISVTGLAATGIIGFANVWGEVDDDQTPNWQAITTTQSPSWGAPSNTQSPSWGDINASQSPSWGIVSETQTPNWQDIAA